MFTAWNDRIEVTAPGAYVVGLLREDRRLGELLYPGKDCEDQRVRRIAVRVEAMADNLRGALRDELAYCGALPLGPDTDDQPDTCAVCGLCSIHKGGPSCFDEECPNALPEPKGPSEWPTDYDRPHCLTCGDRGCIPVGAAGNSEIETTCPDCGPSYR